MPEHDHAFKRGDNNFSFTAVKDPRELDALAISSSRLTLRPLRESDAPDIFREYTPKIATFMTPPPASSVDDTLAFVKGAIGDRREGRDLQLVIENTEGGEFLGLIGLHTRFGGQNPELGLWLKRSAHGNGFGMEAAHTLIDWADTNLRFGDIVFVVGAKNGASRRIPDSYGLEAQQETFVAERSWSTPVEMVTYRIPKGATPKLGALRRKELSMELHRKAETSQVKK